MVERHLILWLTGLCLSAALRPEPFVATQPGLGPLFALAMFAIGGLLPSDELRGIGRRWPTVLLGIVLQYTTMPLLAYGFGRWFGLELDLFTGVILVGCVPGAMASNVLTLLARGNVSYSVCMTSLATLLSPLVVPGALHLALGQRVELDPFAVSQNLFLTVVGPVLAGYWMTRHWSGLEVLVRRHGPLVANLTILWIIAVVVASQCQPGAPTTGSESVLASRMGPMAAALVGINLGGYLAGYLGGVLFRLPEPMRRALTLEVGMQNAGLGTLLAMRFFSAMPAAAIPPALYTFGCMFTGTLLAQIWRRLGDDPPVPSEPAGVAGPHASPD